MSGDLLYMAAVYDGDGNKTSSATLYHTSRTLPDDPVALAGAEIIGDITGGDEGDVRTFEGALSAAMHAMAALTGGMSACVNPALAPEAVPLACQIARNAFGHGWSAVPQNLPDLFLRMRDGKATKALARVLMPHPSLSVTDEEYDVRSYITSSLFEVPEVLATSSTRDGKTSVFYGLQRLSEVREGAAEAFLHDGRGSVAQTILGSSVASWHRYGAFGKVTAGSDTHERTFFGYDSEEQDPLTGLLYLRARYYDTSSARFGVADTYLGNTFDPITQNRYLYCASDPVNHADPTGHFIFGSSSSYNLGYSTTISSIRISRRPSASHPNWYKPTGGTRINGDSFANLPGQLTTKSTLIPTWSSKATKKAQADYNTNTALGIAAIRDGNYELAKIYMGAARATIDEYLRVYCGGDRAYLKQINEITGKLSLPLTLVPILGTYNDLLHFSSEGNGVMSALYAIMFAIEAGTFGLAAAGTTWIKTGTKVAIGAGMREAAETTAKAANASRAIVGGEVRIGNTTIRNSADAARLIVIAERKGHAIDMKKADDFHRAGLFLDEDYLSKGTVFNNDGGTGILLQVEGELNNKKGIFEYVVEADGKVSHQFFVEGGTITGKTNSKARSDG